MPSVAFASAHPVALRAALFAGPVVSQSQAHASPSAACLLSRPARLHVIAAEKLYPDPTPLDDPSEPPSPSSTTDSYLSRLNRPPGPNPFVSQSIAPATSTALAGSGSAAARALWRLGWLTWWVQVTLTVVAAVIILFSLAFPAVSLKEAASVVGIALSALSVVIALASVACTYSYTRLSLWLSRQQQPGATGAYSSRSGEEAIVSGRIAGRLRVGLWLAIAGLVVALLGLQAVVGTLLGRVLTSGLSVQPYARGAVQASVVQPIDVLVVQACANVMMGLMAALVCTVWMRGRMPAWQKKAAASATA